MWYYVPMNILITGGAGYIGGALTDILQTTHHSVRVYDALMYEDEYLKDVAFVRGDVCDRKRLKKQLQWADAVVWLAALVGDAACALNPDISRGINQESVRWLSENFDGRILLTSTCSVYGAHEGLLGEDAATGPLSVYGRTKLAAEGFLKGKNAMIFRLGTLYGVGDRYSRVRLDLAVNTMTTKAVTTHKLTIFGGNQFRPLLHVRDAARAIADNLTTKHTGVFNLHSKNIKIFDLAHRIAGLVPNTALEIVDSSVDDVRNYRVSSRKAQKTFGFHPTRRIEDGIAEIKQLFDEKRIKDPDHSRYTNVGHLLRLNNHTTAGDKPRMIDCVTAIDDRGQVVFANDFDVRGVRRFYMVSNHRAGFVRAWHAHKQEAKYVLVTHGAALIGVVPIDNWKKPAKGATVARHVLSAGIPKLLYIPPGFANGFMTLTADTELLFYSTSTIEESKTDDFRYPARYWDIWKVEER